MKKIVASFCLMILFVLQMGMAQAGELQTVSLSVEGMTCSMCTYTVKKALKKVDGVEQAEAKYEGRGEGWATVTFDPDKTSAEVLIRASTNAGYPAHLKEAL